MTCCFLSLSPYPVSRVSRSRRWGWRWRRCGCRCGCRCAVAVAVAVAGIDDFSQAEPACDEGGDEFGGCASSKPRNEGGWKAVGKLSCFPLPENRPHNALHLKQQPLRIRQKTASELAHRLDEEAAFSPPVFAPFAIRRSFFFQPWEVALLLTEFWRHFKSEDVCAARDIRAVWPGAVNGATSMDRGPAGGQGHGHSGFFVKIANTFQRVDLRVIPWRCVS